MQEQVNILVDGIWQEVMLTILGVISLVILFIIRQITSLLRQYLPDVFTTWLDERRQNDIHAAAMSVVRSIMIEGGDPKAEMDRVLAYMKNSAKDAIARFMAQGRSAAEMEKLLKIIAESKIPVVLSELGSRALNPAPTPAAQEGGPASN